ncbi:HupE/UreJ family protein [Rhodovulum euryhalinum]|uniref:Urease accessory protein n=1 Tax=Rhodovulum euryhalinum TaxID=35805 RepID=A0A4V2SA79_9RHOB|nr:HupE/UreJ family protein [Rhodovulum euryhalinum]TCO70550.1 urease accessory protein [Rhodovulum euryhalinum]
MKRLILAAALAATAAPALAHTGHGGTSGLVHGMAHPILGADHLLAMLAVGLWSGFVLSRHVWAGAAAFMGAMVLGAGLSWSGVPIPHVEALIAASVVVFGALTVFAHAGQSRALTAVSLAAIAGFGACHGHAHATEATGQAAAYLAGFLISTGALHLVGIALARAVARARTAGAVRRVAGAAIAASGAWLVTG